MKLRVVVIVDRDMKEMERLEHAMHLYGFPIVCFKFPNLYDAVDFIFEQPDPIDYLLVDIDTVLPEEEWLRKTLALLSENPDVITAAYSKTKGRDVVGIQKQLATHLVVTLPSDAFKYVAWVGSVLVFNEMKD
jgi:hypothetical protein